MDHVSRPTDTVSQREESLDTVSQRDLETVQSQLGEIHQRDEGAIA
jgi:hypothetical protein